MASTTSSSSSASPSPSPALLLHRGACHCRAVQFEFHAPKNIVAWDCNCSICHMKRNVHVIVPGARFRILTGEDALTTYTFNTHKAKHQFCKHCGVQPFYVPRSNPDGFAVTIYCIEPGTIGEITVNKFDGQNWEGFYEASGIAKLSKEE